MTGLIDCRECDSPYCRGCNIYRLATALKKGELKWLMGTDMAIEVPAKDPYTEAREWKQKYEDLKKRVTLKIEPMTPEQELKAFKKQMEFYDALAVEFYLRGKAILDEQEGAKHETD